jgi:hypothetical protein
MIELEDNRPLIQGPSKKLFRYDSNIDAKPQSSKPWSLALTSTVNFQLY